MKNAITITTPAQTFRSNASGILSKVATMTLHELVDEFLRLTDVMDENVTKESPDQHYPSLNDIGEVAQRERRLIAGAARARFGIGFEPYDRTSGGANDF